jgi:hypothetical protein
MEELEAVLETGGVAAVELAAAALRARGGQLGHCANCSEPLLGPYCAVCGQPHVNHRRSVVHLLHDFIKDVASFDSRILRTAKALVLQPGELALAFREGRTQRYVPAVRLYLFASLLFFLFLSATGIAFIQLGVQYTVLRFEHDSAGRVYRMENGKRVLESGLRSDAKGNITLGDADVPHIALPKVKANGDINYFISTNAIFFRHPGDVPLTLPAAAKANLEALKAKAFKSEMNGSWFTRNMYGAMTKLETDPAALNGPLLTWIPRILFILLPMFAVLLAVFYWRRRREFYFVDHLVFSVTVHTFAFVLLIFAAAAAQAVNDNLVAVVLVVCLSVYLLLSLKRFYQERWLVTGLKFAGIAFIYSVFFLLPALSVAVIASIVAG